MNIVYTLETFDSNRKPSVFLAGPTYRIKEGVPVKRSWREDAIQYFTKYGFDGVLYVPEWVGNIKPEAWTYESQVGWEIHNLKRADLILFWVPRNMEDLPALTTNIEFGEYLHSDKIVVGGPPEAVKNEYLQERCRRLDIPWCDTLEDCVSTTVDILDGLEN